MIEVVIVAFEGISLFHLSVPVAIFQDAAVNQQQLFNVKVCAQHTGKIKASSNIGLDIDDDISLIEHADVVIIPSWLPEVAPNKALVTQLVKAHCQNKLIAGLCLGAYALAYSGLLDGKRATTHWHYGADFKTRFPQVVCDINPLYIAEDNLITSAGSAAAIDCCLYIVKHFYGVKIANKIARMMVSSPERSGGQNQYIEAPTLEKPSDDRIANLIEHVLTNIADHYTLESAADYCMMSVRSFSRNFTAANGISFTLWLINARLHYSLELLEASALPITQVAEQAGFSSEQIFRKHFKQRYDTTPKAWRALFRGS